MAKRETKQTYNDTRNQRTSTDQEFQTAETEGSKRAGSLNDPINQQQAALTGGYNAMMQPTQQLNTRPIDTGELNTTLGRVRNFADDGGFSQQRTNSIMENVGGLKEIGQTGGLSDQNVDRIRGMGGYDEFAKTGGYDSKSIANIKAQAISPIASYATGTRDEMARKAALSGGYTPGFDASNRQLQRDTARNIASTSLDANVGIQDRINAGRQFGIGGLSNAESGLASLQSGNKLQGLQAAGGLELNLQNSISQYRAQGLSMEQATARALAEFDAQNVGNEMGASQFNIQNGQNQFAAGLGGLQGLYNSNVGRQEAQYDRNGNLITGRANANQGLLGNQSQLAVQPGIGGNIMNAVGSAAGIASQFFAPGMNTGIAGGRIRNTAPFLG